MTFNDMVQNVRKGRYTVDQMVGFTSHPGTLGNMYGSVFDILDEAKGQKFTVNINGSPTDFEFDYDTGYTFYSNDQNVPYALSLADMDGDIDGKAHFLVIDDYSNVLEEGLIVDASSFHDAVRQFEAWATNHSKTLTKNHSMSNTTKMMVAKQRNKNNGIVKSLGHLVADLLSPGSWTYDVTIHSMMHGGVHYTWEIEYVEGDYRLRLLHRSYDGNSDRPMTDFEYLESKEKAMALADRLSEVYTDELV